MSGMVCAMPLIRGIRAAEGSPGLAERGARSVERGASGLAVLAGENSLTIVTRAGIQRIKR